MRRVAIRVVCGILGYADGAFGGGLLVSALSSNAHDKAVESAMTGAFVVGPIAAVLAVLAGLAWAKTVPTNAAGG